MAVFHEALPSTLCCHSGPFRYLSRDYTLCIPLEPGKNLLAQGLLRGISIYRTMGQGFAGIGDRSQGARLLSQCVDSLEGPTIRGVANPREEYVHSHSCGHGWAG